MTQLHAKFNILWTIVIFFISQLVQNSLLVNSYQDSIVARGSRDGSAGIRSAADQEAIDHREKCRELISLTLLTFKDLSPDERASEEIDCARIREQIAQATSNTMLTNSNSNYQADRRDSHHQNSRHQYPASNQDQLLVTTALSLMDGEPPLLAVPEDSRSRNNFQDRSFPSMPQNQFIHLLASNYSDISSKAHKSNSNPVTPSVHQVHRTPQQHSTDPFKLHKDQPLLQFYPQNQQLHSQQQHKPQPYKHQQELPPATTNSLAFEELETTTVVDLTTTVTTTTTTTTSTTQKPRIRPAGGPRVKRPKAGHRSTTTTTTTTTTPKPQPADYADEKDPSTDYYDDYEDVKTTTTTTIKPRSKRPRKQRTSTTPKPTTTTTLSPGYQHRPDGRIIDYLADPNFPRELKGADLTNYPFYITVPDKIDFECKGRHDGYYANIDLHCQIYHHCAVGNRYDFLCPNYTLFDQTTFTCRFINTVDCVGSERHFDRNNALYAEKDEAASSSPKTVLTPLDSSTTTTKTTTSTTTTTQAPKPAVSEASNSKRSSSKPSSTASANNSSSTSAPVSALSIIMMQQLKKLEHAMVVASNSNANIRKATNVVKRSKRSHKNLNLPTFSYDLSLVM